MLEFTARLLKACEFNILTVWLYIVGAFFLIEMIFYSAEMLIYGKHFCHIGDVIVSVLAFSYFGYCTWILGSHEATQARKETK